MVKPVVSACPDPLRAPFAALRPGPVAAGHRRYVTFQMAEVVIPRDLFADILRRIDRLRAPPAPA